MIAAQYTVQLPADYDMGIVRHRVSTRGPSFDDFPGLHLKAFLIREKGRLGAAGNAYAPFYVWPETEAMWGFVAGAGFRGIVDSFGRTSITTWLTLDLATRADVDFSTVRAARREQVDVSPGTDLFAWRLREIDANRNALDGNPRLVASIVAVDVAAWRTVRFTLWACTPEQVGDVPGSERFEVLRLSAPGMRGR